MTRSGHDLWAENWVSARGTLHNTYYEVFHPTKWVQISASLSQLAEVF